MQDPARREDSPLVAALFAALDLACDHNDIEIICRLSSLLDRLAAKGGMDRPHANPGGAR